ncbi:MAG: hypothetical protein ABH834_01920, partial [Candidatus Altiarchaeota archaeon]
MNMITDDIGSFPLPSAAAKARLRDIGHKIIDGSYSDTEEEEFIDAVVSTFSEKLESGLDVVTYPQLHEMIEGFMKPIEKHGVEGQPYIIKTGHALIPEVEVVKVFAQRRVEEGGEPVSLRVCVTGPLDLYVRSISTQVEADILLAIGESIGRFVKNSLIDEPYLKTKVISLDEPSLGLNPNIVVEKDKLIDAWNKAAEPAQNTDVQIHLHAPAEAETAFQTKNINVIGIEAAENPDALKAIELTDLESYDKHLRVGIARSNITALSTEYEQAKGVNPLNKP